MQRRNLNPRELSAFAPVPYKPRPTTARNQRSTTDDDTTGDTTLLAQRDNFDRVASMARDAYNIGKELLGELNVEDKIFYYYATSQSTPTVPPNYAYVAVDNANNYGWYTINQVPENVSEAGRTGDSILMTSVRLTARLRAAAAIENRGVTYIRLFLCYWETAQISSFQNFPSDVQTGNGLWDFEMKSSHLAPVAQRDYDSKARVHILWDKVYKLTYEEPEMLIHEFIKIHRHTQFENDSTTINTGALCFSAVSDKSLAEAYPAIIFNTRLYFIDN